jgi:hypothetical protein
MEGSFLEEERFGNTIPKFVLPSGGAFVQKKTIWGDYAVPCWRFGLVGS